MRQFYGHLEKCVLSAGKTMSVKFPFLGGGVLGGGGSADFIFMGADFSDVKPRRSLRFLARVFARLSCKGLCGWSFTTLPKTHREAKDASHWGNAETQSPGTMTRQDSQNTSQPQTLKVTSHRCKHLERSFGKGMRRSKTQ